MNIRLKELREKKGMSQKQIAEAIGISQPAYCYFENGEKLLSVAVVRKLAQVLNCTTDEIIN